MCCEFFLFFSYHWRNLKQILQLATTCIIKQKSNSFKWKKIFELKYFLPDLEIPLFLWRKQCCDIKSVASSNNKAGVLSRKIFELKYFLPDLEYYFIYNSYERNNVPLLFVISNQSHHQTIKQQFQVEKMFELKYFLPDLDYSFIYNSYEENNVYLLFVISN